MKQNLKNVNYFLQQGAFESHKFSKVFNEENKLNLLSMIIKDICFEFYSISKYQEESFGILIFKSLKNVFLTCWILFIKMFKLQVWTRLLNMLQRFALE